MKRIRKWLKRRSGADLDGEDDNVKSAWTSPSILNQTTPSEGPQSNIVTQEHDSDIDVKAPVKYSEQHFYVYKTLDVQAREIRLIKAAVTPPSRVSEVADHADDRRLPRTEHPNIAEISIETFPLQSAPAYTAISYVWGSGVRDEKVICEGKQLPITKNLKRALPRLILKPGWYWIDGVCIDQENVAEKNSQVGLMHSIYKSAREVTAFIGDPPGTLGQDTLVALLHLEHGLSTSITPTDAEWLADMGKHYEKFRRLLWQPWFSRGWVIQEAASNANCTIWYGDGEIPLQLLLSVVQRIQNNSGVVVQFRASKDDVETQKDSPPLVEQMKRFRQIDTIGRLRALLQSKQALSVSRVLGLGRTSGVTDQRDRVFAFLGFFEERVQRSLQPDYSPENSVYQVLTQCARVGIQNGEAPSILMAAGKSTRVLPSWVPNWTVYPRNAFNSTVYECSGQSRPMIRMDPVDNFAVLVQGFVVDRVTKVLRPRAHAFGTYSSLQGYLDEVPDPESWTSMRPSLREAHRPFWWTLLQDAAFCTLAAEFCDQAYPPGENPRDVVWRTITGDTGLASEGFKRPVTELDRLRADAFSHLYRTENRLGKFRKELLGIENTQLFALADQYHQQIAYVQEGRRGGLTERRYLAVLPDTAGVGDLIVIALGVSMPLVLREIRFRDTGEIWYELQGEAYVHGIMDGELMEHVDDSWKVKGVNLQEFKIV